MATTPRKAPSSQGRKYEPSESVAAQVKMLAAMGLTSVECGKVVGISGPTVLKYYQREYEVGGLEASARVAQSLFQAATNKTNPNVIACIFFLKCRAGWREDGGESPGKKEAAELLAKVSHEGTKWDGLLK